MDNLERAVEDFTKTNYKDLIAVSEVPEVCKTSPCALGVDEAGRGPVLGPMVYGIAYCPLDKEVDMKELGSADSKTLTEQQREGLFDKFCENKDYIGWAIHILSPNTICNSMYKRQKYSLNQLSHDAAIGLIQQATDNGINVAEVYVDTVGPPEKYQKKLEEQFPHIKIKVSKKADSLFPVVSTASICAKVARDRVIKNWKFMEGIEGPEEGWGSGYPGDPITKKFLEKTLDRVFGFPLIVRFSWSTAEKIMDERSVNVNWEEIDDQEEEIDETTPSILSFFSRKPSDMQDNTNKGPSKNHQFFQIRHLKQVEL